MRRLQTIAGPLVALVALSGCAHVPTGPTVAVMPAPYKPFELFRADEETCRSYAQQQIGAAGEQAQNEAVGAAAIGTVAGAAVGGLIGGDSQGVATGAGVGLATGTMAGASSADYSSWSLQRRYDVAYEQCMYAKGNQVPGFAPINVPPPPPPPSAPPSR